MKAKLTLWNETKKPPRTSRRPIPSVIIPAGLKNSDFVDHWYDYRENWTQLSPMTIMNREMYLLTKCERK